MKAQIPSRSIVCRPAFVAGLLFAAATNAADPSVALRPGATSGTVVLTVEDSGNHAWRIQHSSDLRGWTDVARVRVYNGRFGAALGGFAGPGAFFRGLRADDASAPATPADALRLPSVPDNYAAPALPGGFFVPPVSLQDNTPADNAVTDAGALLGRALFYDRRLSTNGAVSCASCHRQENGFSDPRRFSEGFAGGLTGRNSMGLANARWYQRRAFFWDERAATLEAQVLEPIQNPVEMGMTLPALLGRLAAEPFYTNLFAAAFGSTEVSSDRVSRSLAQFVRSIVSTRTRYDEGVATGFAGFTASERLGRQLFFGRANCAVCHGTDNFVPTTTINNNGLENPYVDKGVGALTGRARDEGLFKVPSLRNIALTAPYMHDGRFATLRQVVDFYDSGVVNHPNLSPPLRAGPNGGPRRLNLTEAEKTGLVDFLLTLTDFTLATDPKFADPFNYGETAR